MLTSGVFQTPDSLCWPSFLCNAVMSHYMLCFIMQVDYAISKLYALRNQVTISHPDFQLFSKPPDLQGYNIFTETAVSAPLHFT